MSFVSWCMTFSPRINPLRAVQYCHNNTTTINNHVKNVLVNNNNRISAQTRRLLNTSNAAAASPSKLPTRYCSNLLLFGGLKASPPVSRQCHNRFFTSLVGAGRNGNLMVSKNSSSSLLMRRLQLRFNSTLPPKQEWAELQRMPLGQRLKTLLRKYWYVAIPLHCAVCVAWFGSLFLLVKCGVDGTKIISFIQPYVLESPLVPDFVKKIFEKDPDKLGHLAVALLLYKIVTPARYASTVFASIYTIRYLMNKGVLIKSAKEIKNTYVNHATKKNLAKRIDKVRKKITYKNKLISNLPPTPMKPSRNKQPKPPTN